MYALYERSKKILIFLIVLCAIELGSMAILTGVTIGNMQSKLFHLVQDMLQRLMYLDRSSPCLNAYRVLLPRRPERISVVLGTRARV